MINKQGFAVIGVVAVILVLAIGALVFFQRSQKQEIFTRSSPQVKPRLVPDTTTPSATPKFEIKCPPGQEPVYEEGKFSRCVASASADQRMPKKTPGPTATPNLPVQNDLPESWLECRTSADCLLAQNPCRGCPIAVNEDYQLALEQSACASPDPVIDPVSSSRCSWSLLGCPGAPAAFCFEGVCQARPCLGVVGD